MRHASIAGLKARLSTYLQAVKAGEEVIVTERGKPVARLVPMLGTERLASRAASLIRVGQLRPPRGPLPKDFWTLPRPRDPQARVRVALLQEREESG